MHSASVPRRVSILPRVASPLIRWQAGRHSPRTNLGALQGRTLERILSSLESTDIGRNLGLSSLRKFRGESLRTAFRESIPVHRYGDLEPYIQRIERGDEGVLFPGKALALAQTSGTTTTDNAGERWIPQNRTLLEHHAAGGVAALDRLLDSTGTAPLEGRMLMLGGSTSLVRNDAGIPTGDLSGITVDRIPWYLERVYEPGREIALESDWNRKVQRIAQRLAHADVTLVSGIPSWCGVLFEEICRVRGVESLHEAWPNLRAFIHGGVSIDPYLPTLLRHLGPDTWMQEVYPSSEAFLAIGCRAWQLGEGRAPDLEPLANHGVYLEFLPEGITDATQAIGPESLQLGIQYRVLVTTPAGLFRYELGDLIEGRGPGRLRFAGRVKARISVFGEHVEAVRLAEAIAEASRRTESEVTEWHVAPLMPTSADPRGAHEWWIEFAKAPADPARFSALLDEFLRASVIDYDAHRAGDVQLRPPVLHPVSQGTFHRALSAMGKLGGQHKVPDAWGDRTWADRLSLHDSGVTP